MLKEQYPYTDGNGVTHNNLIRHWTDDETKILLQVETGALYEDAVDIYPCPYTYQEVDKPVEEETEEEPEQESEQE